MANSGVSEQSMVVAPRLGAEVVSTGVLDIPSDSPYVIDDIGVLRPTQSVSDAILDIDPDITVFHALDENAREAISDVSPHTITVGRLGINIREQSLAGPEFVDQISDVLQAINDLDHLIASSHRAENELKSHNIDRVTTIPTAVEADSFDDPRTNLNMIGMIGRIGRIKNQLTVVEGVNGLVRYNHTPSVLLAGDRNGYVLNNLKDIIMQMSPSFSVQYAGYVDEPFETFYPDIDLHCHPSWTENCPQTVLEAAVAGVPSIVSSLSWADAYPELELPSCNPDDPWEWTQQIRHYIENPTALEAEAELQQDMVKIHYTTDTIVPEYEQLFEQLRDDFSAFKVSAEVRA